MLWHLSTGGCDSVGMNRCGTVCVSTAKRGRDPDLVVISRTYLSVLRGAKRSQRVPTTSSYTWRPLIGRQNCHFGATGIITNEQDLKVFLDGESFV